MEKQIADKKLVLQLGDITDQEVDAIVNAANSTLLGGGGVDGAIHRAGGPAILEECRAIRAKSGGCPAGEAVATTAGNLKARYVIHTVGPFWQGGDRGEADLLASCYRKSLRLAASLGCRTIAFPSISTGAYRFPIDQAAKIAVRTIAEELPNLDLTEVRLVLFSRPDYVVYDQAVQKLP